MEKRWLHNLFLIVTLATFASTSVSPGQQSSAGKSHPDTSTAAIDTQIEELHQVFEDYENLSHETETVINGLNFLGLYYNKLQSSLVRTRALLANVSDEYGKLKRENEGLRAAINLDRDQLQVILNQAEHPTWWNRWEAYVINIAAAGTSFLIGLLFSRLRNGAKRRMIV
jgi:hypothetical protein